MKQSLFCLLIPILLPLRAWCQSVQDEWTAPASPDGSSSLQSGTPFTLRWKTGLESTFQTYCPLCNVQKVDLWVTSFSNNNYKYKVAGSIDITKSSSYQWDVNIPSAALIANAKGLWVLRFTPFISVPPFEQQISSSGFTISGPPQPSTVVNTVTVQPSSTVPSSSSSSSTPIISITIIASVRQTPSDSASNTTSIPKTAEKSKTWISGVVVGPIVGIALGGLLTWFVLSKKRKNKELRHDQSDEGHTQADHTSKNGVHSSLEETQCSQSWPQEVDNRVQYHPVEAPGCVPATASPAELWHGNYR